MSISSFEFVCAIFLILLLSFCSFTAKLLESSPTVNLSTTWDSSPTLFARYTNAATFVCGFFGGEEGYTSLIFGISISRPNGSSLQPKVIWSANRNHPVQENAILNFTAAGELVLHDVDGSMVWTTNTAGKSVVGMNLTDSGNLVLFDHQNAVVWQSFDHPTDCLLPGQRLFQGQKLKSSVSLTNSSEGMYSFQVTEEGFFAYVESNPPQAYYSRYVPLFRNATYKGRRYIRFLNGSLSFFINSSEPITDPSDVYGLPVATSAQYMKLMPDGHLQVLKWQSNSLEWTVLIDITTLEGDCDYPLVCGRNSICSGNQQCGCPKFEYFRPVNDSQPNLGCSEITPITCNSTQDQDFITLKNIKYFTLIPDMDEVGVETCKQTCLKNCSCKAAFFRYGSDTSSGDCYLTPELFTMQPSESLLDYSALAFIKVQNVTSPPLTVTSPPLPLQVPTVESSKKRVSHQVARVVGSTIGAFVVLLVVAIGSITYIVSKRKWDAETEEEDLDQVPGMPKRFSYEELTTATDNFSKKLGEGGFGSVFEGSLNDGSKIAVKCLEGLSHIKKSFLAEVQSIGSIHHVNLVRLRGFCTWKSQRFLVYDFMSNGSLDRWIYHRVQEHILIWECRKKIILDIAKGLAYLHEECRQKIVHLDIKPQNILLDDDFNAKVSDFGLCKLIDKNQTQVMSTIKGTPGYIAPEWRSSIVTEKLDVYSFGIVLLEILCGRKIFDRSQPEESWFLLSVFQKSWEHGKLLEMVDTHSEDMQLHKTEVLEMMKVAAWCLQTNFKRRPSMSTVVKVLEGGMIVESNLDYNFTDLRIQETEVGDEKVFTQLPSSLLSGPR